MFANDKLYYIPGKNVGAQSKLGAEFGPSTRYIASGSGTVGLANIVRMISPGCFLVRSDKTGAPEVMWVGSSRHDSGRPVPRHDELLADFDHRWTI